MNLRPMLFATTAVVLAMACSDSTGENGGVPPGDLTALRLAPTAPPLCADSVGAWFYKTSSGPSSEIALQFAEQGGSCAGETEDFLRLRLDSNSLQTMPDGTPISAGDSVFISVKWVGSDSILFEMKPSGLKFNPNAKARLKIEYGEAGEDLNHDGNNDDEDTHIEQQIDIYRQESPGAAFFPIGTGKIEEENEIEADLSGFSRFMIAY
jgi:hypothetical protein